MSREILRECMKKGFLLDREMLELFASIDESIARSMIETLAGIGIDEKVITKKIFQDNFEKVRAAFSGISQEKDVDSFFDAIGSFSGSEDLKAGAENSSSPKKDEEDVKVKLINSPAFVQRKINVKDFVKHFRSRFEKLKSILEKRDFEDLTSIRRIGPLKGSYTIIGSVVDKRVTKNKNLMLSVEDLTGTTNVLINQNKEEVFLKASNIMLDDVLAFSVSGSSQLLFCNDVFFPEASLSEKRRHDEDVWVAFISDFHCGSVYFLEKEVLRFIKWLNGDSSSKYQDIAKKIKYLFFVGDLVDGVNHYPGQENELNILSCRGQYSKFEELIKLIRDDVEMVVCPGNHDAVWVGEPQPIIAEKWAQGLHDMKNVHLVPNPSLVEIEGGFRFLMYHGAALNAFVEEMPEIRTKYGRSQPTVIVREMIKRRHLAPMHGLVDYIPCESDPMVINPVPDVIVTADLHTVDIGMMNNILMVASSCWQSSTPFIEKIGVKPDPCKVPLFNLRTREIKILDFSEDAKEVEWVDDESILCRVNGDYKGGSLDE